MTAIREYRIKRAFPKPSLVDRNAGPTEFNQYNSYYSPKDLSPAECARKTRDETRQLLKNVKRA